MLQIILFCRLIGRSNMTARRSTFPAVALLSSLVAGCGAGGGGAPPTDGATAPPPSPPPPAAVVCQDRAGLCADQLLNGTVPVGVDNEFYLPDPAATAALHEFSGTLEIDSAPFSFVAQAPPGRSRFPQLSAMFITVDDVLLPVVRDIISDGSPESWDIILSPGKVWSENTDLGMSRASFPFTLVTNQWNEAHNGVATFLYDGNSASSLHFQVTQETAAWCFFRYQVGAGGFDHVASRRKIR